MRFADVKMHPDQGAPGVRGRHAMAQLALWLICLYVGNVTTQK